MSASNPECHNQGCLCATCETKCNWCYIVGRCTDKVYTSSTGQRHCNEYRKEMIKC